MTRIIVASDSHGARESLRWLVTHETADALIFLGDGLDDLDHVKDSCPRGLRVYRVRGNNDFYYGSEPALGVSGFGGVLVLFTHGHLFGVKAGMGQLCDAAEMRMADVALYGHTHYPRIDFADNDRHPTLFNPGSLRDGGYYGILECEDGQASFAHKRVPAEWRG